MRPRLHPLSVLPPLGLLCACPGADIGGFLGFEDATAAFGIAAEEAVGVCVFDYDGDGRADLLLTRDGPDRLYRSLGGGDFEELGAESGLAGDGRSEGCAWADYDRDGDPDVFVTMRDEPSILWGNRGDGTFVDVTAAAGLELTFNQRSALWEDIDGDGHTDLVVAAIQGGNARLYRNRGDGTFEDRTPQSPLAGLRHSWGGAFLDYDEDGDPDLFLGTDFAPEIDVLLRNDGDFVFTDVTAEAAVANVEHSMGVAVADVDADGHLDFYITNFGRNALWRNLGDGTFVDVAAAWGAASSGTASGWGTFFADFDLDADLDLFAVNGAAFLQDNGRNPVHPAVERNWFFLNQAEPGAEPAFVEAARETGIDDPSSGMGAAWGDLDGDGLLDVVIANHLGSTSRVFRNLGAGKAGRGPLRVLLRGTDSNPEALGARVTATACGVSSVRLRSPGASILSHGDEVLHFGVGDCAEDVHLELRWPSGRTEELTVDPPAWGDEPLLLVEGDP